MTQIKIRTREKLSVVALTFNSLALGGRGSPILEFEASKIYIKSSMAARAIVRPFLKKKKKVEKKECDVHYISFGLLV